MSASPSFSAASDDVAASESATSQSASGAPGSGAPGSGAPGSGAPGLKASVLAAAISPAALFRMPARAWLYFVLYLSACALLLGLVAWRLSAHSGDIRSLVLGYVLPESWHFAADLAIEHLLSRQHHLIVINALVTTSLMAVTVLLFPLKELLSATFEERAQLLPGEVMEEHPLWLQAWQEIKLLLLFIAVQCTIFWLGYLPYGGSQVAAVVLGVLFLWFSFAIDFIGPIFQRHRGYYSQIIKTLGRYAPAALIFGALFCAPTMLVARLWDSNPDWSWTTILLTLFGINVLCIAWAAASGTWLGARLYPGFTRRARSHKLTQGLAWVVLLAVLGSNGYAISALALSVHHKSQILKCDYQIDLDSFGVETPDVLDLLDDQLHIGVHVDIEIHNPTGFDVELEDNEVIIEHRGKHVATTRLAPMRAPAGQTVPQTLRFTVAATPSMIARGRDLLDGEAWKLTLYVQVAPYFRLPVYLL